MENNPPSKTWHSKTSHKEEVKHEVPVEDSSHSKQSVESVESEESEESFEEEARSGEQFYPYQRFIMRLDKQKEHQRKAYNKALLKY